MFCWQRAYRGLFRGYGAVCGAALQRWALCHGFGIQTKGDPAGVSWSAQLPPVPGPQAEPSLSFAFCRPGRWGESMFGGREQGQVTGELGEEADLSGEEFGQIKQGDVEGNEFLWIHHSPVCWGENKKGMKLWCWRSALQSCFSVVK